MLMTICDHHHSNVCKIRRLYGARLLSDITLSNSANLLISTEALYLPLSMDFPNFAKSCQKSWRGLFQMSRTQCNARLNCVNKNRDDHYGGNAMLSNKLKVICISAMVTSHQEY